LLSAHQNHFKGLITVNADSYWPNIDLWAVAHSSAFVPRGSIRLSSQVDREDLITAAAYTTPSGNLAVVIQALYWDWPPKDIAVQIGGKSFVIPGLDREASATILLEKYFDPC